MKDLSEKLRIKLLYLPEKKRGKVWVVRKYFVSPAGGKSPAGIVSSDRSREQAQADAREWTREQVDLLDS
jgi:hypothetical protein